MNKYKLRSSDVESGPVSLLIESYLKSLECNDVKNQLVEEAATHLLTALTEWKRRQKTSESWRHFLKEGALLAESVGQLLLLSNRCLFNEFILKIDFSVPIDEISINLLHEKSDRPTFNQIVEVIASAKKQSIDIFYGSSRIEINELHSVMTHIYPFRNATSHPMRDYRSKQEYKRKIKNALSLESDCIYKLIEISFSNKFEHIKLLIDDIYSEEKDDLSASQQDHYLRLIRDALISDVNPSTVNKIVNSRHKATIQDLSPNPKNQTLSLNAKIYILSSIVLTSLGLSFFAYTKSTNQNQAIQNHDLLPSSPSDMGAPSLDLGLEDEKENIYKEINHEINPPFKTLISRLQKIEMLKSKIRKIKSKDREMDFDNFILLTKKSLSRSFINHKSNLFVQMSISLSPAVPGYIKNISCKIGLLNCTSPAKAIYLKQGGSSCPFSYKISTQDASSKIETDPLEHLSGLQTLCFDPSAPLSIEMDGKPLCQIEGNSVRERVQTLSGTLPGACADLKIKLKIDPSLDEQIQNQELSIDDI